MRHIGRHCETRANLQIDNPMMTQSDVPAGWYSDPDDKGVTQRFWDGRAWTDHTRLRSAVEEEHIPAGWYPDPDDGGVGARYWDGRDWTERTRASLRPSPFRVKPSALAVTATEHAPATTAAVPQGTSTRVEPEPRVVVTAPGDATVGGSHVPTVEVPAVATFPAQADVAPAESPATTHEDEPSAGRSAAAAHSPTSSNGASAPVTDTETRNAEAPQDKKAHTTAESAASSGTGNAEPPGLDQLSPQNGQSAPSLQQPPAAAATATEEATTTTDKRRPEQQNGNVAVPSWAPKPEPGSRRRQALPAIPPRVGFRPWLRLRRLWGRETLRSASSQVQRAVDPDAIDALRRLEHNRLELLLGAVWEDAMKGEVAAVEAATKLIEMRCRLTGIDDPSVV